MKQFFTPVPAVIVLADMFYGLCLNILQGLNLQRSAPDTSGSRTVTPDIAFNSLQIIANGGMVLTIGFGLLVLIQLDRTVARGQVLPIGIFRTLGLLAVLAFGLPALWEWLHAFASLPDNPNVFNTANPRYLITAFCTPLTAVLCLYRLYGWYRLQRRPADNIPD